MTNLTQEQLDMLTKLQPLFKEKMGEWQEGDEFYDTDPKLTRWSQQHGYVEVEMAQYFNKDEFLFCLRIPKPIDWKNPERGCWEMVDWEQYDKKCIRDDGELRLVRRVWDPSAGILTDPFTALLKVLCVQEGV